MKVAKKISLVVSLIALSTLMYGCGSSTAVQGPLMIVSREAPIPEGVVQYCWEEPIAAYEQNGPGIDTDGHWYHPSYTAIREVRNGKWRPCRPLVSEAEVQAK